MVENVADKKVALEVFWITFIVEKTVAKLRATASFPVSLVSKRKKAVTGSKAASKADELV